jgi:hypothetical protein
MAAVIAALVALAAGQEKMTHTGYLADLLCWNMVHAVDGANMLVNPEAHTVHCMLHIDACRKSGFALLDRPDGAAEYELKYLLDETGNAAAVEILRATKKKSNVLVTATGEVDGQYLRNARVVEPAVGALPSSAAGDFRRAPEGALVAHIAFMLTGWGFFIPWGIAIASKTRDMQPTGVWFSAHLRLQTYGWAMQLTGFFLGVFYCERYTAHFLRLHPIVGLIAVILGTLQPVNSMCRPHPIPKTRARLLWECVHKLSGRVGMLLAVGAMITGVQLVDAFAYEPRLVAAAAPCVVLLLVPPAVYALCGHLPFFRRLTLAVFWAVGARGTLQGSQVQPALDTSYRSEASRRYSPTPRKGQGLAASGSSDPSKESNS